MRRSEPRGRTHTNLRQRLYIPTILRKVFHCTIIKNPRRTRTLVLPNNRLKLRAPLINEEGRYRPVGEVCAQATRLHALKAKGERTLSLAELDSVVRTIKRGRASRTVIVHVDDRDMGEAEVVEGALHPDGENGLRERKKTNIPGQRWSLRSSIRRVRPRWRRK